MTDDRRSIELEVDVVGTPEEVWRAIATGPGISSWYVPHVVEEREGGTATASFGPEPEMQVSGRVSVWDPLKRIVFDGGDADVGLVFDWQVASSDDHSCVVRLVNSGFETGNEWNAQFDAMTEGWKLFLSNLRLHLANFGGQTATAMLPMANWTGPADEAWRRLLDSLGLPVSVAVGDRIDVSSDEAPALGGTVVEVAASRLALLVDDPAPGTAFIAAEGRGEEVSMSIWAYLYGERGATAALTDEPRWRSFLMAGAVGA